MKEFLSFSFSRTNALCWALMFQLAPMIKECGNMNQSLP